MGKTKLLILGLFMMFSFFVAVTVTSLVNATGQTNKQQTRVFYPMVHSRLNCARKTNTTAQCNAKVVVDTNNNPITAKTPKELRQRILQTFAPEQITPTSAVNPAVIDVNTVNPARLHTAYNIPCTPGGSVQETCPQPANFGPQTIAIVDAYGDPNVESDLQIFNQHYGLPSCTKANGCLQVVNQNGSTSSLPTRTDWIDEITLDVQTAHAICQTCKILLVESNTSSLSDLATATRTAAAFHPTAISLSWGGTENTTSNSFASSFNFPGIAVVAASGDGGYNTNLNGTTGVSFPANLPFVVAAGGTTLTVNSDDTYAGETVWNGTGSGCASLSSATNSQTTLTNWAQTNCGTKRGVVDMAADADPSTGAAIYFNGQWWYYGGTSLATPIIASAFALNNGINATSVAPNVLYANYKAANFHDITTGSNGTCSTIMCGGFAGYDGPTGLGTLNGLGAFVDNTVVTTPTPTVTATPTPSINPPTVSITSPVNGSWVSRRSTVTIKANATDPLGITKVAFYVNNTLLCTDTTAPYSCAWLVPSIPRAKYTLSAKAYNTANLTSTNAITVTAF